jgi:hypothetical protein
MRHHRLSAVLHVRVVLLLKTWDLLERQCRYGPRSFISVVLIPFIQWSWTCATCSTHSPMYVPYPLAAATSPEE